jgi:hypothetical protein
MPTCLIPSFVNDLNLEKQHFSGFCCDDPKFIKNFINPGAFEHVPLAETQAG